MILEDFILKKPEGLFCKYGDFYLDPTKPATHAIVSHAHGDHAVKGSKNVYCTPATKQIMQLRSGTDAAHFFYTETFHTKFTVNGIEITFIPAGHILGSAQILLTYQNIRYLYTGDIKTQPDATCEPFETVPCDVLITETTFANPSIIHPETTQEIMKLNHAEQNVILGTYALGKAQRLTKLISENCPTKTIYINHTIAPIHKLYEQLGIVLGTWKMYDRKEFKKIKSGIYLVPPITFDLYRRPENALRAFASGWEHLQKQCDLKLYISDHADWNEILTIIKKCNPTQIWTTHGDGTHLKLFFGTDISVKLLD